MKIGAMMEYRSLERFLLPGTNKVSSARRIPSAQCFKAADTAYKSAGFFKTLSELFSPLFEKASHIFG